MTPTRAACCGLLVVAGLCSAPTRAGAQTCVPPTGVFPGLVGAPRWWDATNWNGAAQVNQALWDAPWDPRWIGAMSLGYGDGATGDAEFRAVMEPGQAALLLSWYVKAAPDVQAGSTSFLLGILPAPNGTPPTPPATVLRFTLRQRSTVTAGHWAPQPAVDLASVTGAEFATVEQFNEQATLGNWDPAPSLSPWLAKARVWIRQFSDTVTMPAVPAPVPVSGQNQWAVQVRIPIGASVNELAIDPAAFRLWFQANLDYTYAPPTLPAAITLTWPRQEPPPSSPLKYVAIGDVFPASTIWGPFTATPGASTCTGVSIADAGGLPDIGTDDPTHGSNYIDANRPSINFHVGTTSTDLSNPSPNVTADFKFANWGAQIGTLTASSFSGPAELAAVAGTGGATLTAPWTPDASWRCKFLGNTQSGCTVAAEFEPHQCVLVTLHGAGVNFLRSSAYRNMDFANASVFTRSADISVAGLPPTPAGKRDVYLYVETMDMGQFDSTPVPQPLPAAPPPQRLASGDRTRRDPDRTAAPPLPSGARPRSPGQVVHAYYDTGQMVNVAGTMRRLLVPETSFGYQVRHQGPLEGWLTETLGATPIAGSTTHFKVTAPDGGAAKITTVIEAVEPKRLSVGLSVGAGLPQGNWSTLAKAGLAGALDVEYQVAGPLSLGLGLGYDAFDGKSPGVDVKVLRLSAHARFSPLGGRLRPFLLAGAGSYHLDPGSTAGGGFAGLGLQLLATHSLALELSATAHSVSASPRVTWVDALAGVRLRF